MPRRVRDNNDLRAIRLAAEGFVYNDSGGMVHKAACPSIKTMKVFAGTDTEYGGYKNPGVKYFDRSRDNLVLWLRDSSWLGGQPEFCTRCSA
jgi:hypothetical protein